MEEPGDGDGGATESFTRSQLHSLLQSHPVSVPSSVEEMEQDTSSRGAQFGGLQETSTAEGEQIINQTGNQAEMPSTTGRDGHNGGPLLEWSQAFSRMLQNGQIRHQNGNVGLQAGSPHNGNAALQMANGVLQNGDGVAMKRQASLIRENSFKRQNSWAVRDPKSLAGNTYTYAWGNNDNGQLGLRTLETQLTPQLVRALKGREIVSATGNLWNSAFLTADGELLMCGSNENGQLGWDPARPPSHASVTMEEDVPLLTTPTRVASLDAFSVHHAVLGLSHAVAVVGEGRSAAWGANELGQLGQGSEGKDVSHPRLAKQTKGTTIVRAAAGQLHTLILSSAGVVSSFGHNEFGQLGRSDGKNSSPGEIKSLWPLGIVQIACGDNHSVVLTVDGNVFSWGRGKYGQLGLGNFENCSSPTKVKLKAFITQISCGADHTLACTSSGKVFSWGRNSSGQTGQGTSSNLTSPRLIQGLSFEHITQVSAGSSHSLALSKEGTIFAWGNGQLGQLGRGDKESSSYPVAIRPWPGKGVPKFVIAAGDHSIAVCQSKTPSSNGVSLPGQHNKQGVGLSALSIASIAELAATALKEDAASSALVDVRHAVADCFSNPGYLVFQPGCQMSAVSSTFYSQKISEIIASIVMLKDSETLSTLSKYSLELLQRVAAKAHEGKTADKHQDFQLADFAVWEQALFILYHVPLYYHNGVDHARDKSRVFMKRLIRATVALGPETVTENWFRRFSATAFRTRFLQPLQRYLSYVAVHQATNATRQDLLEALVVLDALRKQWQQMCDSDGSKIRASEFHNPEIGDSLNLETEYTNWRVQPPAIGASRTVTSVCQLPFCLNPEAKAKLLGIECRMTRQHYLTHNLLQGQLIGGAVVAEYLDLPVTRENLLANVMSQISQLPHNKLRLPLRVHFMSNAVHEEGVDQGGVAKEFFQLLVNAIFSEDLNLFVKDEETNDFWFNHMAVEDLSEYNLLGKLIGLAVYNGVILDLHFPSVFYKKLKRRQTYHPSFQDLKKDFPALGRSLQQLLDMEEDVESTVGYTFEVEYDYYGEMRQHPLIEGGGKIPVTNANRKDFVKRYAKWMLQDSIQVQFTAFAAGFFEVCSGPALELLSGDELELAMCGTTQLNFEDLESVARYEGGYNQQSPTIKNLWAVLHRFSLEEKQMFLKYTTGSHRAPVGGLGNVILKIQRAGPDSDAWPTSHTCFNYLLLPDYSSKEKLRRMLSFAIKYAEGFGLQ